MPEYQNKGLMRVMGEKIRERFPDTNIIWCVRPDNKMSRDKAAHYGALTSPPPSLGSKKLKKNYLYFVVNFATTPPKL